MLQPVHFFYLLIAFSLSSLVNYLCIALSHSQGIFMDEEQKIQKVHRLPTPRIGGLGIFLGSMFILCNQELGGYVLLASVPAFIAGFLEDYTGNIAPAQRLAIMCLSPVMAFVLLPATIFLHAGAVPLPGLVGIMGTLLLTVALVNGVNFVDGQNGLAGGAGMVIFAGLALVAHNVHDRSVFFISLVPLSAISGFMLFNYPAGKIFLGDGGAYFMGFLAATLTVLLQQRHGAELSPMMIPALLVYPLCEVAFSTVRKLVYDRISPFKSDGYHFHHLLYRNHARGRGHVVAIYLLPLQILVALGAVAVCGATKWLTLIVAAYILVYTFLYANERRKDTKSKQALLEA
ncbi:MAG: glycosyltransferase [Edaphocola sp.]